MLQVNPPKPAAVFDYSVDVAASRRFTAPRRGDGPPPGQGASGSHHLPWALPRVVHVGVKIKRLAGGSAEHGSRARGVVYSKGVNRRFIRGKRASSIAARVAH